MDKNLEGDLIEKVLLATITEQRRSRRWKIFFRLFWILVIAFLFYNAISKSNQSTKCVGVVNLEGVIDGANNTYSIVSKGLENALKNKRVVAVIIKANSPGGSPVYSDMLYNDILRLRKKYPNKPIVTVVEEVCASGCYYIASATDKIYAQKASIVGSIGVIYMGFGLTNLMQKIGVDSRLLISGKNKAMGYPFVPEATSQKAMQQSMLDQVHKQFIMAVKNGRGKQLNLNDPDLFSGRYWIGEQAKALGLIDGYMSVDDLARDQYKLDTIVNFTPQDPPLDKLAKKLGVSMFDSIKQKVDAWWIGKFE